MDAWDLIRLVDYIREEPQTVMIFLMLAMLVVTIAGVWMAFSYRQPLYAFGTATIDVALGLAIWVVNRYEPNV